jgi:hypothetical protein
LEQLPLLHPVRQPVLLSLLPSVQLSVQPLLPVLLRFLFLLLL